MKKLKRLFINKNFKRLSCVSSVGAGFVALGAQAQAQTVIIQDNFTQSGAGSSPHYGTSHSLNGLSPDTTDLPDTTYLQINNNGTAVSQMGVNRYAASTNSASNVYANYPDPGYYAYFQNGSATGISLNGTSSGSANYDTGQLLISADLSYGGYYQGSSGGQAPSSNAASILGFATSTSASNYGSLTQKFTGLKASYTGSLQEYVNGSTVGSAIAYVGTYNYGTPTLLSYDIDTSTGAITNVSFGSSTATYNFGTSGSFSNADTAVVDLGGTGGGSFKSVAQFGDLLVETAPVATPEPSTYALLAGGLAALTALQLRRRHSSNSL